MSSRLTALELMPSWIIWFSMLAGNVILQLNIWDGLPHEPNQGHPPILFLMMSFAGIVISTVIRWLILPKAKSFQSMQVMMVIGLAFAESAGMFEMFLIGSKFPETQRLLFCLSVAAILQFIPLYASSLNLDGRDENSI
ncbi:hypothetical protein JIN85_14425 [Luteolibacter pohnpeiensis]|uniref:Uncharacterized protein n=1 Tax=Luteolibacter pohnpeiensis TaxID=454153 RepID=A0A934S5T0_9BACT|nr:hypothetical protein [Luteolibacter pohnpeiensis]MBK1883615.1 hypothetical protein [Luteolibacter pohnpeiensis]